jgi:hypothetical protein
VLDHIYTCTLYIIDYKHNWNALRKYRNNSPTLLLRVVVRRIFCPWCLLRATKCTILAWNCLLCTFYIVQWPTLIANYLSAKNKIHRVLSRVLWDFVFCKLWFFVFCKLWDFVFCKLWDFVFCKLWDFVFCKLWDFVFCKLWDFVFCELRFCVL